jgi:ERCC4-type nuclease
MVPSILYVDSRVGSREFADTLHQRHKLKVRMQQLEFGDFAFIGNGPSGPMKLCVERKTLGDLCGSLMKNRLSSHQIPGMLEHYDMAWILVEGIWRPNGYDAIEVWKGGGWKPAHVSLTYSGLEAWMVSFDVMGGGRIKRWKTSTPTDTAHFIATLFRWWQKPWTRHTSHEQLGKWAPSIHGVAQKAMLTMPTVLMRVAAALPEIGGKTARKVGRHFRSIHQMMNAEEEEWQRVIGKKDGTKVWSEIRKRFR